MRIIGGQNKRTLLHAPKDDSVSRPITDRVKESVYNILMARGLVGEGLVLDVFAGVGSLGLEALSRGAEHCTFVEQHRQIRRLLERNLANLRLEDKATVLKVDALAVDLGVLVEQQPAELIFVDPPYPVSAADKTRPKVEALLARLAGLAEPGAGLVLRTEHPHQYGQIPGWLGPDVHQFGKMLVHIYDMPEADSDQSPD